MIRRVSTIPKVSYLIILAVFAFSYTNVLAFPQPSEDTNLNMYLLDQESELSTPELIDRASAQGEITAILDNFNRANGAIGSNWSGNIAGYDIQSNQLHVKSKNANLDIYWNNSAFGPNQEAYFTFSTISSTATDQDLILKAQSTSGWGAGFIQVWYDAVGHRVQVWTFDPAQSWIQHGADIPVTFVNGDQFGARARADGIVEVYRNGVPLGTRSVTTWPHHASGGYLGIWFGNAKDALIDNFGGGNVP